MGQTGSENSRRGLPGLRVLCAVGALGVLVLAGCGGLHETASSTTTSTSTTSSTSSSSEVAHVSPPRSPGSSATREQASPSVQSASTTPTAAVHVCVERAMREIRRRLPPAVHGIPRQPASERLADREAALTKCKEQNASSGK